MAWTTPKTWSAGDPLTASDFNLHIRDNLNDLYSGGILQVVQGSTATMTTNSTNTYADSGLTATITPAGTANKVLVIADHMLYINQDGDYCGIRVLRGTAIIHEPIADATGPYDFGVNLTWYDRAIIHVLDSPNTTSATTYKTQFRRYQNGGSVRLNGDGSQTTTGTSRIILMEVGG